MADTLYSHSLRILACQGCGAPLEAAVGGGSFTCTYCGAVNRLAARDERRDLERAREAPAISESERYSRLREQERAGEALPASIAALVSLDGTLEAESVERAKREWLAARAEVEAAASFPVQERFFHLTVLLAPHFAERARRAVLETAAEVLSDERHRHVLRCLLATYAAREGDTRAAEEWLSACNPRPVDLAMDSSYRLAAATVATVRGDHARTLAILGARADDIPVTSRDRLACALLRIDALERLERDEEATAALRTRIAEHGEASVRAAILEQRPLRVCEETWFRVLRAHHRRELMTLERMSEVLERRWFDLRKVVAFFAFAVTFAVGGGAVWAGCADVLNVDPFFGSHAKVVCPRVCAGCRGPYHYGGVTQTFHRGGKREQKSWVFRYCEDPHGRIAAASTAQLSHALVRGETWMARYRVSDAQFYPPVFVFFVPLGVGGAFIVLLGGYRWRVRRRREVAERLAEVRAQLAEVDAQARAITRWRGGG